MATQVQNTETVVEQTSLAEIAKRPANIRLLGYAHEVIAEITVHARSGYRLAYGTIPDFYEWSGMMSVLLEIGEPEPLSVQRAAESIATEKLAEAMEFEKRVQAEAKRLQAEQAKAELQAQVAAAQAVADAQVAKIRADAEAAIAKIQAGQ